MFKLSTPDLSLPKQAFKKLLAGSVLVALVPIGYFANSQEAAVGLGTPISEAQLAGFDLIASPDGTGFPAGSGTAAQGMAVYQARCQACHGADGEGLAANMRLVGGDMHSEGNPVRTVGSFWPYASTLFDYVRRAMPADSPKSLTDEEVYQVTAYVLFLNGIIEQNHVLNSESLNRVEMPNRNGFIDRSQVQE